MSKWKIMVTPSTKDIDRQNITTGNTTNINITSLRFKEKHITC